MGWVEVRRAECTPGCALAHLNANATLLARLRSTSVVSLVNLLGQAQMEGGITR